MSIVVWAKEHYAPVKYEDFENLLDAIRFAVHLIEDEINWPWYIEVDGEKVWEQSGPFTTSESLRDWMKVVFDAAE